MRNNEKKRRTEERKNLHVPSVGENDDDVEVLIERWPRFWIIFVIRIIREFPQAVGVAVALISEKFQARPSAPLLRPQESAARSASKYRPSTDIFTVSCRIRTYKCRRNKTNRSNASANQTLDFSLSKRSDLRKAFNTRAISQLVVLPYT